MNKEAPERRKYTNHIDVQLGDQTLRTERESKEKNTAKQIIEAAERLFRKIGWQKTTLADIASELNMSSSNIYRFFTMKSEINEAVCMDLLGKIEGEAERIAACKVSANQRIRELIGTLEKAHLQQFALDRNLYDLVVKSIDNKWAIARQHNERMTAILVRIIASGVASGELSTGDPSLSAILINTACLRYSDPRLAVEYEQAPEPTIDQMIDFCLLALSQRPV